MAHSTDIGQRIRKLREARGMPKAELARRAGTTRNTLYRIESGRTAPSSPMVEQIARGLNVEPGDLYLKEGRRSSDEPSLRDRFEEALLETDSPADPQRWEQALASVRERQRAVEAKTEELIELSGHSEVNPYQVKWALDEAQSCADALLSALPGSRKEGRTIALDLHTVDLDQWGEWLAATRFYESILERLVVAGLVVLRERAGQKPEPVAVGIGA